MENRFFNEYPYTDFHELNLSWVIQQLRTFATTLEQFVSINALKYANPIQWDITSQYEKNTIVIDPQTGTAYISVQPVPAGVSLTNPDYWCVVFELEQFVTKANNNFTVNVEELTTPTATFSSAAGDWLIWGGDLYKALTAITAGDQYVVDSNIKKFTMEDVVGHPEDLITLAKNNLVAAINEIAGSISALVTSIGDLNDLTTTDKSNLVNAINEVLTDITTVTGDLVDLDTTDKSNLVNAINEVLTTLTAATGDLNDLTTTDKSNLVNAINEVLLTLTSTTGDLNDLNTVDKSNLVNAINETLATAGHNVYNPSEEYGLDSTGGTDCSSILSAVTSNVGLKEGTYLITNSCTINCQLVIPEGAKIQITSGANVTFNGQILAGRYKIFDIVSGDVIIGDFGAQNTGFPEWFGAAPDHSTDCTSAIQKCIDVFEVTSFDRGEYRITDTLKVTNHNKKIRGYGTWGREYNDSGNIYVKGATTIWMDDLDKTIMQVGPDTKPAQFNDFLSGIEVRDITFYRLSDWHDQSIGIIAQYILRSNFINVMSYNSSRAIYNNGVVYTRWIRCQAHAAILPDSDLTRNYCGFFCTATVSIGAAGSNASLYLLECSSSAGGVVTTSSYSVQAFGSYGIADIYIDKLETVGTGVGIALYGTNANNTSLDVYVTDCVLDQVGVNGIELGNMSYGCIKLSNNYIALGAKANGFTGTQSGIVMNTVKNATVTGNEIICFVGGTNNAGITITDVTNSVFTGNLIYDAVMAVAATNCLYNTFNDVITNQTITTSNGFVGGGCQRNIIRDSISGSYSSSCILLNSTCQYNEVDITPIDRNSGTIAIIDNVAVTTTGSYSTNEVIGA